MAISRPGVLFGQAHHLFGEVTDLHRLAHVEGEYFAALPQHAGLQDQLAGFRNRHEVARDFRDASP